MKSQVITGKEKSPATACVTFNSLPRWQQLRCHQQAVAAVEAVVEVALEVAAEAATRNDGKNRGRGWGIQQ